MQVPRCARWWTPARPTHRRRRSAAAPAAGSQARWLRVFRWRSVLPCWWPWRASPAALLLAAPTAAAPPTSSVPLRKQAAASRTRAAARCVAVHAMLLSALPHPCHPPSSCLPLPPLQNRLINLTVGTGAAAVPYQFAVDTGSSLLEVSCQSAAAQANCGGTALADSYVLTPASAVASADVCAATGIGCFVGGACYFSQGVSEPAGRCILEQRGSARGGACARVMHVASLSAA